MNLIPALGFAGSLLLTFAAFPTARQACKQGRSSLPAVTTWCILLGLILNYCYLHASRGFDPVVAGMYGVDVFMWLIVLRWTLWPREFKVIAECTYGVAVANPKAMASIHFDDPKTSGKPNRNSDVFAAGCFVGKTSDRMKRESKLDEAQHVARNVIAEPSEEGRLKMMRAVKAMDPELHQLAKDIIGLWRREGRAE